MSYFMITAGPWIDLSDLSPLELISPERTQYYIRDLHTFLSREDGEPLYPVDDGETGTSHNFIIDACDSFFINSTLTGTTLLELCRRLCHQNHVFRIWWASNDENAHTKVMQ